MVCVWSGQERGSKKRTRRRKTVARGVVRIVTLSKEKDQEKEVVHNEHDSTGDTTRIKLSSNE